MKKQSVLLISLVVVSTLLISIVAGCTNATNDSTKKKAQPKPQSQQRS
jgi:hypothetical protein